MQPVHLKIRAWRPSERRAELLRRLRAYAPGVDMREAVARMSGAKVRRELRRFR